MPRKKQIKVDINDESKVNETLINKSDKNNKSKKENLKKKKKFRMRIMLMKRN